MLLVGIDVSKSKHNCYIVDSEGTIYETNLQISNNIQGFKTLSNTINSICNCIARSAVYRSISYKVVYVSFCSVSR